jgi:hypothetical protein
MSEWLAELAVGARKYRVHDGREFGTVEILAFDGTVMIGCGVVKLPLHFQLDRASLAVSGADIVVSVVAFHCKDDSGMDGTWVVDASCATRSTSW